MAVTLRALGEALGLVLGTFTLVWVARVVGPAYVGYLAVASTLLQGASLVASAGLPSSGAQRVAVDAGQAAGAWWTVAAGRLAAVAVVTTAVLFLVAFAPVDPTLRWFLALGTLSLLPLPLKSEWLLVALGEVAWVAALRVLGAGTSAAAAVVLIRSDADAPLLPMLLVFPVLVTAVAGVVLVARLLPHPAYPGWGAIRDRTGPYLRDGVRYMVGDLSVLVYSSSDRLFLYVFTSPVIVGLYDAAYKIIQPFYSVSAVVTDAMFRRLANTHHAASEPQVLRRYIDLLCVATVPLGFVCAAYSSPIIEALYGPSFAEAAPYLALLGWVISFGYVSGVVAIPFTAWGLPGEYGKALLGGGVVNLGLNVVLIPPLAGAGAALATIASKITVAVLGLRPFWRETDYPVLRHCARFFLGGGAALAVSLVAQSGLGLSALAGLIVYGAAYAVITIGLVWRSGF